MMNGNEIMDSLIHWHAIQITTHGFVFKKVLIDLLLKRKSYEGKRYFYNCDVKSIYSIQNETHRWLNLNIESDNFQLDHKINTDDD
jgi:hypothetical protein